MEIPVKGHGLWYQVAEVERCVARGELESPACTWVESEGWAATLEGVARAAGLPALASNGPQSPESSSAYRSRLRVAVVGMGRIGSLHITNLKALGVGTVVRLLPQHFFSCALRGTPVNLHSYSQG